MKIGEELREIRAVEQRPCEIVDTVLVTKLETLVVSFFDR